MIRAEFRVPQSLHRFLDCLKPAGRHHLFSAAAASVSNLVRRHIAADAPRRHFSSSRLGAAPTGFMEKAARKTVFRADAQHGEVVIPSPGFGRAFHDVEIVPTHGAALTLPISEFSYGRRVKELRSMGWIIFRPKAQARTSTSLWVMARTTNRRFRSTSSRSASRSARTVLFCRRTRRSRRPLRAP